MTEQIVAIGLLTQDDLDRLGSGFHRAFPLAEDDMFADLIERLNHIDPPATAPRKDDAH